jgi:cell division septation protein DedD
MISFFSFYYFSISILKKKQKLKKTEKPFKFENIYSPDIRFTEASNVTGQASSNVQTISSSSNAMNKPIIDPQSLASKQISITPQNMTKQVQTPATLTNNGAIVGLHKQLKYEESPSLKINQSCDMVNVK